MSRADNELLHRHFWSTIWDVFLRETAEAYFAVAASPLLQQHGRVLQGISLCGEIISMLNDIID